APEWTEEDLSQLTRSMVKFPGGTPGRWEKIAHELGRSVTDVTAKVKQLKDSVTCSPGMVRLSELKSTAQNSRSVKTTMALPDDIITQREDVEHAEEEDSDNEQGEDAQEQQAMVLGSQPRRRKPARLPEAATKVEPEEKFRGKRQKDFDISEQNESSDEESQKRERTRAVEEPWTQSQQKLLELALQQYPKGSSDRWDKIAKCVPSKSK
ncbi:DnaJ subfamily C member 1, partial [Galemys pyrenaicus]